VLLPIFDIQQLVMVQVGPTPSISTRYQVMEQTIRHYLVVLFALLIIASADRYSTHAQLIIVQVYIN